MLEDEMEDPWSQCASRGLKMWATKECTMCVQRQQQSSLAKHIENIDFSMVRSGELPLKLVGIPQLISCLFLFCTNHSLARCLHSLKLRSAQPRRSFTTAMRKTWSTCCYTPLMSIGCAASIITNSICKYSTLKLFISFTHTQRTSWFTLRK